MQHKKTTTLKYSIRIHYFPEVLPRLFCCSIYSIVVAIIFIVVLHIFTHGGCEVGARSKDKVLPQPDGSILSGGTVHEYERYRDLQDFSKDM